MMLVIRALQFLQQNRQRINVRDNANRGAVRAPNFEGSDLIVNRNPAIAIRVFLRHQSPERLGHRKSLSAGLEIEQRNRAKENETEGF